jgi:hypothetical protein
LEFFNFMTHRIHSFHPFWEILSHYHFQLFLSPLVKFEHSHSIFNHPLKSLFWVILKLYFLFFKFSFPGSKLILELYFKSYFQIC